MKNKLVWGLVALVLVCAAGATLVLNWQNWFNPVSHNLENTTSGEPELDYGYGEEAYSVKYIIDGENIELDGEEFSFEKNEGIVFLVTNGGSLKLVNIKAEITEGLANLVAVSGGSSFSLVDSEISFGEDVDGDAVFYTKDNTSKIAIENSSISGEGSFSVPVVYGNGTVSFNNVTANLSTSSLAVLKDGANVTLNGGEYTAKWPFVQRSLQNLYISSMAVFEDGNATFTANNAKITQQYYSNVIEEGAKNVHAVFSTIGGNATINLNDTSVIIYSKDVKFAAAVNDGKITFNNSNLEATRTDVEVGDGASITGLNN
ncbi:hypothetical protein IKW73_01715 [Candidatus Saccharibacteria bacterium]|nr:hypothetical protein [Candidatus Saccharibacteria bacterium]